MLLNFFNPSEKNLSVKQEIMISFHMSMSGLLKARMAVRGEGSEGEASYHSSHSRCQHINSSCRNCATERCAGVLPPLGNVKQTSYQRPLTVTNTTGR